MSNKEETIKNELENAYGVGSRVARSSIAVIDTIVQRGGFKGEELSTIGQLRDQCVQLVQAAEAFQAGQTQEAEETPQKK